MGFRGDARRIARYNAGAMRFTQRFKRLTVWNKIGFIASVASIGSIPLSLFLFLLSQQVSVEKGAHPPLDAGVQEAQGFNVDTERQAEFKLIVSFLASKWQGLVPEERTLINALLSKVHGDDIKGMLRRLPEKPRTISLNKLLQTKQVVQVGIITGLIWNGSAPAQIRYFKPLDASLDLQDVSLALEDGGGFYETLPATYSELASYCASHPESPRLELFFMLKPGDEASSTKGGPLRTTTLADLQNLRKPRPYPEAFSSTIQANWLTETTLAASVFPRGVEGRFRFRGE